MLIVAASGMDKTTCNVSMHERDEAGNWIQILSVDGYVGKNGMVFDSERKEGCGEGRSCGEDIINKQDMPDARPRRGGPESRSDVARLFFYGKARLRFRASAAPEGAGVAGSAECPCDGTGDDFRLVVAAAELPRPVERHGDHEVHVREMRRLPQLQSEKARETPPGGPVVAVFQRLGNLVVRRSGLVDKERGGVGVVLPGGFYAGVYAVRQRVMGEFPEMGKREPGCAWDAQRILGGA